MPKKQKSEQQQQQHEPTLTHDLAAWRLVKITDFPGGQINYPLSGKQHSLLFLPASSLPQSRTLERPIFLADMVPFEFTQLACALLPEHQEH